MKLIKVNGRGREIEMQLKTISPWEQGDNASFRGACVEVLRRVWLSRLEKDAILEGKT